MQRIPFPAGVNPHPSARYYRTLAEAFPCDAAEAVAIHSPSRRTARWPWVLAILLLILTTTLLVGCSSADAGEQPSAAQRAAQQELRRELTAARHACPPGHAVEWLGPSEMQCLKEK